MLEIWADEACTIRPDSLTLHRGDTIYIQINRDFGVNQRVFFTATEEEGGQLDCFVQCYSPNGEIVSIIDFNQDAIELNVDGTINAGSVYDYVYNMNSDLHLLSFSLGPIISDNPTIVPNSVCSVPIFYDITEQVYLYAIACLNTNGEYVFLEAANNSSKVHVTSQKYDGIPVFAFTPSPLPTIENPSANVPFTFSAAYNRQFGKHAPYTHRLDNVSEIEPGSYDYAISLLVNNTVIYSQNLITGDESPLAIPESQMANS